MKTDNIAVMAPQVVAASFTSDTLLIENVAMLAIQAVYSAATTCVIKVQVSCDEGAPQGQSRASAAAKVVNWTDVPAATTASLSGAGTVLINIVDPGYNWIRVVITGAITIDSLRMNIKGI